MSEQTSERGSEKDGLSTSSTVQIVPLAEGLYMFSVRAGSAEPSPDPKLALPALQISSAPTVGSKGNLTLLGSPTVVGTWLTRPGDTIVAQVTGGVCEIALTSLRAPNMSPLTIDVRRLDQVPDQPAPESAPKKPVEPPRAARAGVPDATAKPPVNVVPPITKSQKTLRTQVLTHIQNRGDVPFVGSAWAGFLGQRLWLEAFSIAPLEQLGPDALEYRGKTGGGFETPWLSGGAWCGTRGMGVPLVEFAVRLTPAAAALYECEYSAAYLSGSMVGPNRNGAPCRSTAANDALEAIQIRITERQTAAPVLAGSGTP